MTAQAILFAKGNAVVSVHPEAPLEEIASVLAERGIGAVVVRALDGAVIGVVSERDVVAAIADRGAGALAIVARRLMRGAVTCHASDDLERLQSLMTGLRTRHLLVMADGRLQGIVSIGDVVKVRMEELEHEGTLLRDYIAFAG